MIRGCVLFDIDGTLLRAGDPVHARVLCDALEQTFGITVVLDGVPLAGMLDRQIARCALERAGVPPEHIEERLAAALSLAGQWYCERLKTEERMSWVLPGVRSVLPRLADAGYALGVLTGNVRAVARAKLAATALADWLPIGAYGDQAEERSALVALACAEAAAYYGGRFEPARTVLVGDTPRDIAAAHGAGARALAVATGRYDTAALAAAGADAVLPNLANVEDVLTAVQRLLADYDERG